MENAAALLALLSDGVRPPTPPDEAHDDGSDDDEDDDVAPAPSSKPPRKEDRAAEKKRRKREANRISAQLSRQRRKAYIKQLEAENRELRRHANLLDTVPDIVFAFGADLAVTYASRAAMQAVGEKASSNVYGCFHEESVGRVTAMVQAADTRRCAAAEARRIARGGSPAAAAATAASTMAPKAAAPPVPTRPSRAAERERRQSQQAEETGQAARAATPPPPPPVVDDIDDAAAEQVCARDLVALQGHDGAPLFVEMSAVVRGYGPSLECVLSMRRTDIPAARFSAGVDRAPKRQRTAASVASSASATTAASEPTSVQSTAGQSAGAVAAPYARRPTRSVSSARSDCSTGTDGDESLCSAEL